MSSKNNLINLRQSFSPPKSASARAIDDFHHLMLMVSNHLKLPGFIEDKPKSYRVRVDNTVDLHFFPDTEGYLTIVGSSKPLPHPVSSDCLHQLLTLNTYLPLHPTISVGVDRECKCAQVWTREAIGKLKDKKAAGVVRLLKLVTNAVIHVNAVISGETI